jgi:hypothetical protein
MADNLPPLPPGFTLDSQQGPPPLPPGFTLDAPQQAAPQPQAPPAKPTWRDILSAGIQSASMINPSVAGAETALNAGSGMIAAPVAGLAGVAQGAKNLVSEGMPAGDRVRQVQSAMTYEPKSVAGQQTTAAVQYPFEKLAEGADFLGGRAAEVTGSPMIGAIVNTGVNMAPALIARQPRSTNVGRTSSTGPAPAGVGTPPKTGPQVPAGIAPRAEVNPTQLARQYNYKLKPSEAEGAGKIAKTAEGLSGSSKLEVSLSVKNQKLTNELAGSIRSSRSIAATSRN